MTPDMARRIGGADLYRLLALCFRYPQNSGHMEGIATLAAALSKCAVYPDEVRSALAELVHSASETLLRAAQAEYLRLFDTAPSSSPYETSYDPVRKDRILGDVGGFYRAFGLQGARPNSEMPDHIGVELEFLSVVALKAAYADHAGKSEMVRVCDAAHASFLSDHVGRWYRPLADAVDRSTALGLYRWIAQLLVAGVCRDLELFNLHCETYGDPPAPAGELDESTCPLP